MSHMKTEALEAPDAAARFLSLNANILAEIGRQLAQRPPPAVLTSARGSSDHAAGYFKYLVEITTGVPCASIGASVVSVYGAKLRANDCLAVTISQSGKSPDIVALQEAAKVAGAFSVAIVNTENSPAALSADICLPLHAGPEKSVAATKSFITSLVAGAAIVAAWMQDKQMMEGLARLPEQLSAATRLPWPDFVEHVVSADSLYVVGRGPSLPIAAETALKLKETCAIHAEAYSTAEVMHGPLELLGLDFPVLAFAQNDAARVGTQAAIAKMRHTGARVVSIGGGGLLHVEALHPLLHPILMIQTAYLAIEQVAQQLGRNPDQPHNLKKVTETV